MSDYDSGYEDDWSDMEKDLFKEMAAQNTKVETRHSQQQPHGAGAKATLPQESATSPC